MQCRVMTGVSECGKKRTSVRATFDTAAKKPERVRRGDAMIATGAGACRRDRLLQMLSLDRRISREALGETYLTMMVGSVLASPRNGMSLDDLLSPFGRKLPFI